MRDIQANVEVRALIGRRRGLRGWVWTVTRCGGTTTNRGARWVLNGRGEDGRCLSRDPGSLIFSSSVQHPPGAAICRCAAAPGHRPDPAPQGPSSPDEGSYLDVGLDVAHGAVLGGIHSPYVVGIAGIMALVPLLNCAAIRVGPGPGISARLWAQIHVVPGRVPSPRWDERPGVQPPRRPSSRDRATAWLREGAPSLR